MWMQKLERNNDVFMKKRICTFRMDDITPAMNWERFRKIEDLFKKYDIRPLIGVVPDNRDPKLSPDEECSSFWEEVKRLHYPHNYYVDLSQELYDLRLALLHGHKDDK